MDATRGESPSPQPSPRKNGERGKVHRGFRLNPNYCSSARSRENLFQSATGCGRGLSFGTTLERNAPESVTPPETRYVHRNISR